MPIPGNGNARRVPTASVVICCYSDERFDDLLAAVRSIAAQTPPPLETVVVVDHNAGLLARLSSALPGTRLVPNEGPKGLSGARNAGIAATSGDLVVFLDDDASAHPEMVSRMASCASDPDVLGVAGGILPDWDGGAPAWFPGEFLWVVGCTYSGLAPGPVRNPIGAAMAVRRDVFGTVGGFATGLGRTHGSLPLGCEETELAIRASARFPAGRFVHVPDASCRHRVPATRATWSYLVTRCWAEGLSKAALSRVSGADRALATERTYVRRTLPLGAARGIRDLVSGDVSGFGRAVAIAVGLGCTVAGYVAGHAGTTLTGRAVAAPVADSGTAA